MQFNNLGELLPKLIKLLLQGCTLLLRCSHLISDFANLRVASCGNHHTDSLTSCNVGTLVK